MAKKDDPASAEPPLVPVIMDRISTFWLSHYDHQEDRAHLQTARQVKTPILPGLTYQRRDVLERAGVGTRSLNVRLRVADPRALDMHDKRALAAKTTSKAALRTWRDSETDPEAIAMLDLRIHGTQVE
jgi:hypothetical protein